MKVIKENKMAQTTRLTLISFFVLIIIGGFLLNLPISNIKGKPHNLFNSIFMSTASVCVAGVSVLNPAEQYTLFGKIVMLILIQIGALGFIFILSAFILLTKRQLTYKDKISISTLFGNPEKINEVKSLIKRIVIFTICVELVGALILCIRFVPMFGPYKGTGQALFTSISAFCNCGFDLLGGNGLKEFATDYLVLSVIAIQTIMGSLGFIVWNELLEKIKIKKSNKVSLRKTWLTFSTHTKLVLVMLVITFFVGAFGVFVFESKNPLTIGNYSLVEKVFTSIFHSISARTTGMSCFNVIDMTSSGKFFTIILMFIGGAPGGTAGGIKTTTLAILFIAMVRTISNNKSVNVFRRQISEENIKQAITVLVSALIIISIATMVISALNPQIEFIDAMFEVVSALATCGYSLGITASLTTFSKVLIIIIMYIGRVSSVTLAMAILGKKFKQNNMVQYPIDNINIG